MKYKLIDLINACDRWTVDGDAAEAHEPVDYTEAESRELLDFTTAQLWFTDVVDNRGTPYRWYFDPTAEVELVAGTAVVRMFNGCAHHTVGVHFQMVRPLIGLDVRDCIERRRFTATIEVQPC